MMKTEEIVLFTQFFYDFKKILNCAMFVVNFPENRGVMTRGEEVNNIYCILL